MRREEHPAKAGVGERMTKRKQRLKPDVVLKSYWRDNGRFADLFNAVLFGGRQEIRPEELEDVDTQSAVVTEHREHAEGLEAARDSIKVRKLSGAHGMELVLLGNEGQEHVHYAMPMRVMGYDYGSYKKQYDSNALKYRKRGGLKEDEYLSGMKKSDKLIPVITIVVYYGEKPWDGAVTLHGMLKIPAGLKKYVNDYRVLLVEAGKHNLNFHNADNIDLFSLLGFFLDKSLPKRKAWEKAIEYSRKRRTDRSVIMTVAGIANSRIDSSVFEKGGDSMYAAFEEVWQEGKRDGIEKGRVEGKAEGKAEEIVESGFEFQLSEEAILERLQRKLGISLQTAREYFIMYKKPVL